MTTLKSAGLRAEENSGTEKLTSLKKRKKYNHNYGEIHEGISFIKLENDTFILANKAKIEKS
jgi:hypothetical protein